MDKPTEYFAVTLANGNFYTESPEDQARAYGPRLLRLFRTANEASTYKSVLDVYVGEALTTQPVTLSQVRRGIKKARQGVRVEICHMPKNDWPKTLSVVDVRENTSRQLTQTQKEN